MKLPCEKAIWYVLPQIRADLARELVKGGLSQKEAAERLGVTPAAVSQYMSRKRAGKAKMHEGYPSLIEAAAKEILKDGAEESVLKVVCGCCAKAR